MNKIKGCIIFFSLILAITLFSCNTNDPKNWVVGTWIVENTATCLDGKITIESKGGELFTITLTESGVDTKFENVVLKNVNNEFSFELMETTWGKWKIEILPESKKLKFMLCVFDKQ